MPFEQYSPYPFTMQAAQSNAPAVPGVYGLVNASRWIFVGQTDDLKAELLRHLESSGDSILKWGPTGFVFEACSGDHRQIRRDVLVLEYAPICNVGASKTPASREKRGDTPLRFILKGFMQEQGSRRFDFEGIAEDYGRSQFTVHADLNLARSYGIPVQELPLLCRELLERRGLSETDRHFTFTEEEMRQYRDRQVAAKQAALLKRKAPRRPPTENLGAAWRATAPSTVTR